MWVLSHPSVHSPVQRGQAWFALGALFGGPLLKMAGDEDQGRGGRGKGSIIY